MSAIAVRGLGKRYRLGNSGAPLWALRDVSFEIRFGEVLGILGPNGAGKTTLLKVLARITESSEGEVEAWGRVVPLLEAGAGFHPELTARENILLGGVILGMRRHVMVSRLDAIVTFAGLEAFVDVPLKRYSSGMYVRLAFALATHLEGEILLLDEVLAVADAAFRRKCVDRIRSLAAEGRAILFASHDASLVQAVCSSALLLAGGRVVGQGSASEMIAREGNERVRD